MQQSKQKARCTERVLLRLSDLGVLRRYSLGPQSRGAVAAEHARGLITCALLPARLSARSGQPPGHGLGLRGLSLLFGSSPFSKESMAEACLGSSAFPRHLEECRHSDPGQLSCITHAGLFFLASPMVAIGGRSHPQGN